MKALEFAKAVSRRLTGRGCEKSIIDDLVKKRSKILKNKDIYPKSLFDTLIFTTCYAGMSVDFFLEYRASPLLITASTVANLVVKTADNFIKDHKSLKRSKVTSQDLQILIFECFLDRLCDGRPSLEADLADEDEDDEEDDVSDVRDLIQSDDKADAKWGIYMTDPEKVINVANELGRLPPSERGGRIQAIKRMLGEMDTEIRQRDMFSLFVRQHRSASDKPN